MKLYQIILEKATVIIEDGEYSKLQFSIEADDLESMQLRADLHDEYLRLPPDFFDCLRAGCFCNVNEARKFVDFITDKWKDKPIHVEYIGPDDDELYPEEDGTTLY